MTALFDNNGRPSCALLKILSVLNVQHDNSLDGIVESTQKMLLRPAGKERWEIDDIFKNKQTQLYPLFEEIDCVKALHASRLQYDYGVVLGALFERVRDRLQWLIDEWKRGVRFTALVFLTGQRSLIAREQEELRLFLHSPEVPTDEVEMVKHVYEHSKMPEAMKNVPVVFINARVGQLAGFGKTRATTDDTVNAWLVLQPLPGSVLAVSNQPYVMQQHCVLRLLLPLTFSIETIGPKASDLTTTTIFLDNLARWIYQIKRLSNVYTFA